MSADVNGRESGSRFRVVRLSAWALLAISITAMLIYQSLRTPTIPLPRTVVIYGFSAMETVMNEAILPAFQDHWEARTGQQVELVTTFTGSAEITHEILRRVPVDVAILSSELDALRLTERGVTLGSPGQPLPHAGVFSRSPMVLLARADNPKKIRDFADLSREGIELVHADPVRSGGAEWGILSIYASSYRQTHDRRQAMQRVAEVWDNVVTIAPSVRAARREFQRGNGDVLITYESEAIEASRSGAAVVVYPPTTMLSEHFACKITRNIQEEERELIDALVEFLWSAEVQESLVRYGFRSVEEKRNRGVPRFRAVTDFMTVDDLGGARAVKENIVEALWRDRILARPTGDG